MRANMAIQPPTVVLPLPSLEMLTIRVALTQRRSRSRKPPSIPLVVRVVKVFRFVMRSVHKREFRFRRLHRSSRAGPARPRPAKTVA